MCKIQYSLIILILYYVFVIQSRSNMKHTFYKFDKTIFKLKMAFILNNCVNYINYMMISAYKL